VAHSVVLQSRVHLVGALKHADVQWALRAADFLLQASHREGSGYAVIEALACGTTPIVTDIPSFRRITGGGAVGALFSAGDVHGMARALLRLTAQDQAALRTQATRHFEVNLTFDAVGRELRAAYTRVAAS
jgi:glycosyltransferase involved in cell wall biosynthesis